MSTEQTAPGGGWWGWKNGYYRYVGTQKQFFVDDFIVEEMDGLKRVLNQPVRYEDNPVLQADQLWEQDTAIRSYGSLVYDDDERLFKMWYSMYSRDWTEAMLAYATSRDGLNWEKPDLGLIEYQGSRDNNLIFGSPRQPTREEIELDPTMAPPGGTRFEGAWVIKDPVDTDPDRRYKMLFRGPPRLAYYMVNAAHSPDGVHWTFYKENPVIPLRSDTANNVFWDPRIERYVVFVRLFSALGQVDPSSDPADPGHLRIVGRSESRDFVNWTPAEVILIPDEKDRETGGTLHDMEVLQYEGVYFGFLGINRKYRVQPSKAQNASEDHIETHTTAEETESEDVELTFSRDGVRWIRVGEHQRFMALPKPYDRTPEWIQIFQSPLIVGDEIWFYYNGIDSVYDPNPLPSPKQPLLDSYGDNYNLAVGLAKLRLDGFISVEAGEDEGVLTTRPFQFKGDRLVVNADAGDGELAVEILEYRNMYRSVDLTPIDGFTRTGCVAFKGNNVRHEMAWKSGSDLVGLEGKTIKLKFYMRNAKLYSFQFRG